MAVREWLCCSCEEVISSSWCLSDSSHLNDFPIKMLCLKEEQQTHTHTHILWFGWRVFWLVFLRGFGWGFWGGGIVLGLVFFCVCFQLAYIETQTVNQKVNLVLSVFYINPTAIIILTSFIYSTAADFCVDCTDKMKLLTTVVCFPCCSSPLLQ